MTDSPDHSHRLQLSRQGKRLRRYRSRSLPRACQPEQTRAARSTARVHLFCLQRYVRSRVRPGAYHLVVVAAVFFGAWGIGRPRHGGNVGASVVLALLSTACYASSAVVQQQEAASSPATGVGLLRRLIRRPRWWLAIIVSAAAALLHIAALVVGPLSVVQPLGVLTLVLALPLGARWGGRVVTAPQWAAAAAVVLGLAAVLAAVPHHIGTVRSALLPLLPAVALVAVLVALLLAVSARLPARGAPVLRAAAAGSCFGFASAMTRMAAIGAAPLLVTAAAAVSGAACGIGLTQLAYRNGGLGAPLAILILVDPLVAVLIGVAVLGDPVPLTPVRISMAVIGIIATAAGISVLARAGAGGARPARVAD